MAEDVQLSPLSQIAREQARKFYGKYRGTVIDNADDKKLGRLLVEVPTVLGTGVQKWALGVFAHGGNSKEAAIFIPAKGSQVLVEFIEGAADSPVWSGVYYPPDSQFTPPPSFDLEQGQLHLIRSEMGIEIRIEDDRKAPDNGGNQRLVLHHPKGGEVVLDKDGVLEAKDHEGATLMLDPANKLVRLAGHGKAKIEMSDSKLILEFDQNRIELDSSGVTITAGTVTVDGDSVKLGKGASSSILNADAFVQTFANHFHPTAAPGSPTSPPVPPTTPASVSLSKVKGA